MDGVLAWVAFLRKKPASMVSVGSVVDVGRMGDVFVLMAC